MPPLFTVITVCYNAAPLLERTLVSVQEQDYPYIEYIVVDGASSDATPSILKAYSSVINKLISEPDRGIYDAMNKGLRVATGRYLCFLNAGDTFATKETVSGAMKMAKQQNYPDVLYGETLLYNLAGNYVGKRHLQSPEQLTYNSFREGMLVCHQSFYPQRELVPEYNLKYKLSADYDWCLQILKRSKTTCNLNAVLTHYLNEGATTQNRFASLWERLRIMVKHYGACSAITAHLYILLRWCRKRWVVQ